MDRVRSDALGRAPLVTALLLFALALAAGLPPGAHAAIVTYENDAGRTGVYKSNDNLNPGLVSSGTFGQLFATQLPAANGHPQQIYAQPLIAAPDATPNSKRLVVATEQNHVYELDRVNGTILHSALLAPGGELPFDPTNHHLSTNYDCTDLTPSVGITSTPVIDTSAEGGRGVIYVVAKFATSGAPNWSAEHRLFELHLDDLSPVTGFENGVLLTGAADNAPGVAFAPNTAGSPIGSKFAIQRSALLYLNGVIYIAFAGHCDLGSYRGWILGVNAGNGAITARWTTDPTSSTFASPHGGGIWMAGGGLMSDGPGRIFALTGNAEGAGGSANTPSPGFSPPYRFPPLPGDPPPIGFGEAAVRLQVGGDGKLIPQDFFTPSDADTLDDENLDFGSGGISAFPDSLGTAAHPHLMAAVGKGGVVYLLDRDNLGGFQQGAGSGNADVAEFGPAGAVWGKPVVWDGGGGWMYVPTSAGAGGQSGSLDFYRLSGGALVAAGHTADAWGFGSGSPIVTQQGPATGTALVWAVHKPASGLAELRAYLPTVAGGQSPTLVAAFPVGAFTKFAPPGVSDNRLYVGNATGQVYGFGYPVPQVLSAEPGSHDFDFVPIGGSSPTVVLTYTVTAEGNGAIFEAAELATGSSPDFVIPAPGVQRNGAPIAVGDMLATGDEITIPVKFMPTDMAGQRGGAVTVATNERAATTVTLTGYAQQMQPFIDHAPASVSFGAVAIGGHSTRTATFTNLGATALHVSHVEAPDGPPITVLGVPPDGAVIPGCSSASECAANAVTLTIHYDPTSASPPGGDATSIVVHSDATNDGDPGMDRPRPDTVAVTGTADTPPKMVLTPVTLNFGDVKAGTSLIKSFTVANSGGTPLTISRSKPPDGGGFTAVDQLPEATVIQGHSARALRVRFAPLSIGSFMAAWSLAGTGSPTRDELFTGTAGRTKPPNTIAHVTRLKIKPTRFRAASRGSLIGPRGRARVTFTLDLAASVRVTVERRNSHGRYRPVTKLRKTLHGKAGVNSFRLAARRLGRPLASGLYRLRLDALNASGKPNGQVIHAAFRLLRPARSH